MVDPYTDEHAGVLRNLLGLTTQRDLEDAEADYVSLRLRELADRPLPGDYDLQHFLAMHKYIFQDMFDWAGKIRTVNIYKEEPVLGGLSVEYSKVEEIATGLIKVLEEMHRYNWREKSVTQQVPQLAGNLADLWRIHAFREGNTRTTITFICQFADENGMALARDIFEQNSAYVRTALVAYCAKFSDGADYSKKEYLEKIIADAIQHGKH